MTLSDVWDMILNNFLGFLLIMCRVSGIFSFNPIFSRSNFPVRLRAGTTIALAVLFASSMGNIKYEPTGIFMMLFDMMKELGLGLILGFMVNLILAVTISAGELIDYQTGLLWQERWILRPVCRCPFLQTFITICSFCISF